MWLWSFQLNTNRANIFLKIVLTDQVNISYWQVWRSISLKKKIGYECSPNKTWKCNILSGVTKVYVKGKDFKSLIDVTNKIYLSKQFNLITRSLSLICFRNSNLNPALPNNQFISNQSTLVNWSKMVFF